MNISSFEQQLMEIQSNLLNFALTLTNDRDDAYDLLQDTTVKALTNRAKFTAGTNLKGWVFTIMRNLFINNYRRSARAQEVADTDGYHLNLCQEPCVSSPEGSFAEGEIRKAIEGFDPKYGEPFAMHVAGYKYNEIAEKMNLPLGTVKSRIFSARQALQERFADYM